MASAGTSDPAARAAQASGADSIPFAQTILALPAAQLAAMHRTVGILFRVAHSPAYAALVDATAADTARFEPGNHGVFMGYDFHWSGEQLQLIEINTNAGGALLNGLHTASLCDPARLDWLCCDPPPIQAVESAIVDSFRSELAAARGSGSSLSRVAIVDDRPDEQFLRPEFELFVELFARHGIEARIGDTRDLARAAGGVALGGWPVDLVYLRDTDFQLAGERSRALREAYLAREVVVTPTPREHHLLADKRRLEVFGSVERLEALGVEPEEARYLASIVPETRALDSMSLEEAWAQRRDWVFKPAAAFGSRAVYRGDKISRRKLAEIHADPGYLAQRRIEPGVTQVRTPEGDREMKFDLRAYVYRDEILLLGARVYQGQVTNMRSPGGGFSAICCARRDAPAPPASPLS